MTEANLGRATAVVAPIIAIVISVFFALSFLFSTLFGLPYSLNFPIAVRLVGGAVVVVGLAIMAWVFKHRSPANVIVSTYVTFSKLFKRTPVSERAGRTEPLVVSGPQKYVRNPLYFGVVVMLLGWSFLTAYTFVFIATIVILLWFGLVIIPFEEKELNALFGEEWKRYSEETPMLFPFTKRKKHGDALESRS
jgi:protein-S-isoprenylcysteine O-methyltransferase Ste14